jgi:hypothetical protein
MSMDSRGREVCVLRHGGASAKLPIFPHHSSYRRAMWRRAEVKLGRETVELDGAAG